VDGEDGRGNSGVVMHHEKKIGNGRGEHRERLPLPELLGSNGSSSEEMGDGKELKSGQTQGKKGTNTQVDRGTAENESFRRAVSLSAVGGSGGVR